MRARYSAYVLKQPDYIVSTTHPDSRSPDLMEQVESWMQESTWSDLTMVRTQQGGPGDAVGEVEFRAEFTAGGEVGTHHERSRFEKSDNQWYYVTGELVSR